MKYYLVAVDDPVDSRIDKILSSVGAITLDRRTFDDWYVVNAEGLDHGQSDYHTLKTGWEALMLELEYHSRKGMKKALVSLTDVFKIKKKPVCNPGDWESK